MAQALGISLQDLSYSVSTLACSLNFDVLFISSSSVSVASSKAIETCTYKFMDCGHEKKSFLF